MWFHVCFSSESCILSDSSSSRISAPYFWIIRAINSTHCSMFISAYFCVYMPVLTSSRLSMSFPPLLPQGEALLCFLMSQAKKNPGILPWALNNSNKPIIVFSVIHAHSTNLRYLIQSHFYILEMNTFDPPALNSDFPEQPSNDMHQIKVKQQSRHNAAAKSHSSETK